MLTNIGSLAIGSEDVEVCLMLRVAHCMSLVACRLLHFAKSLALAVPYHPEDKDEHNTFDKWVKNQKVLLAIQSGQLVDLTMPVSTLVSHPACAMHFKLVGCKPQNLTFTRKIKNR